RRGVPGRDDRDVDVAGGRQGPTVGGDQGARLARHHQRRPDDQGVRQMARKVFVVGVGMTKFEKPGSRDWDYPDMVKESGTKALDDAGIPYAEVEQAVAAYCYGDSTSGQEAIYELGLSGIPIVNVNNNCSTGSSALFLARQLIAGGMADCALAIGFEKMEKGSLGLKWGDRRMPMSGQFQQMVALRGFGNSPPAAQVPR